MNALSAVPQIPALLMRHSRMVYSSGENHYPMCACGWVGTACLSFAEAHRAPCDVAETLKDSAERLRRVMRRRG